MSLPDRLWALVSRISPPALPSALSGGRPALVLGRLGEQRRLRLALEAAAGRRRTVVISAPAGGGKSYLLRRVLADSKVELAAGVAFPPLGARPLDPVRALLAELGCIPEPQDAPEQLGARLGAAASTRARLAPSAVVIDDIHWADEASLDALANAIRTSAQDAPLAWMLSTRTAALPLLEQLTELADARIVLPPLAPRDRETLLAHRLGAVADRLRTHTADRAERGNPLYLEHLADSITERGHQHPLPGTLHEAVLARLGALADRARGLTHWSHRALDPGRQLETLEREVGDWLDRLETSDLADLQTIGRYLAQLRRVDAELVIARSLLRMPVTSNRRLTQSVERLAAASTDTLLGYLATVAEEGRQVQAAHDAQSAAARAERALRLADAERLLAFACLHAPGRPELARKRGDLALALGRPHQALLEYSALAADGDVSAELQRRIARAETLAGRPRDAAVRLERTTRHRPAHVPCRAARSRPPARCALAGATPTLLRLRSAGRRSRRGRGHAQETSSWRARLPVCLRWSAIPLPVLRSSSRRRH